MNTTPRGNRPHIAIFGKRNAGKSSLINAITNQDIALVSETKGTTTDPVYKSMEILPLGPVVLIDTPGLDDEGDLGKLRVKKALEVLEKTDLAIIVIDGENKDLAFERKLVDIINKKTIPLMVVINKIDINNIDIKYFNESLNVDILRVSAKTKKGIDDLKNAIANISKDIDFEEPSIIGDLINKTDVILHVVPIDKSAPKGRLILPQVQTIRDVLDYDGINIVVKDTELKETIDMFRDKIKIVVTDSQAFGKIRDIVPKDMYLTSYSILYARYKGELTELVKGAKYISNLRDGDNILISESCTHHSQVGDIGRDKIPKFLEKLSGKDLNFQWSSGSTIPEDLSDIKMILHCGGCMINRKQMVSRINQAKAKNIPIVNYGVFLGLKFNVLDRALDLFPKAKAIWEEKE